MLTNKRFKVGEFRDGGARDINALKKAISDYLLSLESPGSLTITQATIDGTPIGGTTPDEGAFTQVTTTLIEADDFLRVQDPSAGQTRILIGARRSGDTALIDYDSVPADGDGNLFGALRALRNGTVVARIVTAKEGAGNDNKCYVAIETHNGTSLAERLRVTSDGRLYGTALHNNTGAVTGTTNQYVASGTFSATGTAEVNVSIIGAVVVKWMRVGNIVSATFSADVSSTAGGAATFRMDLPIASNLAATSDLAGTGWIVGSPPTGLVGVWGDPTNNAAHVRWNGSGVSETITGTYQYEVL